MPYATNEDMPPSARNYLPAHAQSIFREAFNHALQEYGDEPRAVRVAWAAVKRSYRKSGKQWVPIEP